MRAGGPLERRLAIGIGLVVTLLWAAAAAVTSEFLRREIGEQFDAALAETAQRILPLAAVEILGREDEGVTQRLATIRPDAEQFTYVVRDAKGSVLFQSHDADPAMFPPAAPHGFRVVGDVRYYDDSVLSGSLTVTMAEPLAHRRSLFRKMQIVLGLPLFAVIPLSFLGIALIVRRNFRPLRRLRAALEQRGAGDLSPIEETDPMPDELTPVVGALNNLLVRLSETFEAERSFAANAAHELRTPLAGAIAQAQRLQAEAEDPRIRQRGEDIERTLKRLTRLSERLMQLARAEGGRLRTDKPDDIRPVLTLVVEDITRMHPGAEVALSQPPAGVRSDIDPDAFGILCRNLVENALKHGRAGQPVDISLSQDGLLTVTNACDPIAPEDLARLTARFERHSSLGDGTGLGLAIARTIAERSGGQFTLSSPAPGRTDGFQARFRLPLAKDPAAPDL